MSLTLPAWLAQHGSGLRHGAGGTTWFVLMGGEPNYSLTPVPAQGKFGCVIRQTNNGRQIASSGTFPTQDEALQRGLEDLGKELGWV